MTFISYAQNYEDVMLWRALKHINNGFYIDVGANDPEEDSVTKAFYDRGWHGINVEPLKLHYQDLCVARERDINLLSAVGEQHGQIEIWECDVRGWATASADVIAMHEANRHVGTYHKVPVIPLRDICAQYAEKDIHFIKIDVEGFEKEVIRGMDFIKYRPWIVVVEATKPNSTLIVYHEWESYITDAGYLFAYTDGLNRFYLASERRELMSALSYPPNIFDGYKRAQQHRLEIGVEQAEAKAEQAEAKAEQAEAKAEQAEAKAEQAEAKAEQAEAKAEQAEAKAEQAEAKAEQAEAKAEQAEAKAEQAEALAKQASERATKSASVLVAVHNSWSWRLTVPLRVVGRVVSAVSQWPKDLKQILKAKIKLILTHASLYVNRRPKLRYAVVGVLARFPTLKSRLKVVTMNSSVSKTTAPTLTNDLKNLTPLTRHIYIDLKAAIERQQKERR